MQQPPKRIAATCRADLVSAGGVQVSEHCWHFVTPSGNNTQRGVGYVLPDGHSASPLSYANSSQRSLRATFVERDNSSRSKLAPVNRRNQNKQSRPFDMRLSLKEN